MKMADGCFAATPLMQWRKNIQHIEADKHIIDIATARVAAKPGMFDVIVTENLYGDIVSDVAAEISGSVGLAGSSNVGEKAAMFEAIHGSAPDIAGQGIANPSGLLLGAVQMLTHINQPEAATAVHNALLRTIEDGTHTGDIYKEGISKSRVGTEEFTDAVVANLGEKPAQFKPVEYKPTEAKTGGVELTTLSTQEPDIRGVDVFVRWDNGTDSLVEAVKDFDEGELKLAVISYRGLKVYPKGEGSPDVPKGEFFRCRYRTDNPIEYAQVLKLLGKYNDAGIAINQAITTYFYGEERGYSLAQGE